MKTGLRRCSSRRCRAASVARTVRPRGVSASSTLRLSALDIARVFFLVVDGLLDVMTNGDWTRCGPGSFVDLPPETTHTFINNTERPVVWLTGWRPKGFAC